jgi:hypothetical protein
MTFADAISAMRYFGSNGFEVEVKDRDNFALINKEYSIKQSFTSREIAISWVRGFAEAKMIYDKGSK